MAEINSGRFTLNRMCERLNLPAPKYRGPAIKTPEDMAQELRLQGLQVRVMPAQQDALSFLNLPAPLLGPDQRWKLLIEVQSDRALVEDVKGLAWLSKDALAELEVMLEWVRPLPEGASLWRRLVVLLLGHREVLIQLTLASLVIQCLSLIMPFMTRLTMDQALPEGAHSTLAICTLGLFFAGLGQAWTSWVRERAALYLETRLDAELERGLLSHLLALPFPFLQKKTVGELLQAFYGLGAARDALSQRLVGLLMDGVMAVLVLGVMGASWAEGSLAVALITLLMTGLTLAVGIVQVKLQRKEIDAQVKERSLLSELLEGISTVKAAGAEGMAHRSWMGRLGAVLDLAKQRQRWGLWSEVGMDLLRQGMNLGLLIWGARLVLSGNLSVGSLLAFVQMSGTFLGSALGLGSAYLSLVALRPQVKHAEEILSLDPVPPPPRLEGPPPAGPIRLEDVWFRYDPDGPWVLKELHLTVEAGEKRWLRWPSGAGKSTLMRILAGLYDPVKGTASIAGRTPSTSAEGLIYLPQFVHLYGGSIWENLRVLSAHAPREKLMAAAQDSGLQKLVSTLPMGFETLLSSGGGNLSGGQRQLIAITAVMASDRPILLLDEALANLDWISRSNIIHGEWLKDRTVIYASHDAGF